MSVPAFAISGTGTETNPYLISSASDIEKIHNDLDGYYKLINNIDMSGVAFEPIGNENEGAFAGTIDGAGYTISNLNINLPENKYVGFVGYLEGTVKNLTLTNVDAYGYRYVGGIAGYASDISTITDCYVDGNIYGVYSIIDVNVGGVVGYNSGIVEDCENSANNSSSIYYTGGIIGYNYSGTVNNCINNGVVSSDEYAGGIIGYNRNGTVNNCINNGEIYCSRTGNTYGGGITGYNRGTINNSQNTNTVCVSSGWSGGKFVANGGGISGYNIGIVENSENSGKIISKDGHIWTDERLGGIVGSNNGSIFNCTNISDIKAEITTTSSSSSASYYSYVGGICGYNESVGTINKCVNNGNCSAVHKSGYTYVGGITAYNKYEITNCVNNGDIVDTNYYVGGIAGYNDKNTTILNSANNGVIPSSGGGIVYQNAGNVFNCINNTGKNPIYSNSGNINNITLSNITVSVNNSKIIPITLYGYDGPLTYSSIDESIAVVTDDGVVTGKKAGTALVSVTTEIGVTSTATVTVQLQSTSIQLNKNEIILEKGYTEKLIATMLPMDSTDIVSWSSSSTSYATVAPDGTITAKNAGQATITATTTSGQKAYCVVKIVNPNIPVASVTLDKTEHIMTQSETVQLKGTILPSDATNKELTWTTTDETIAKVSDNGVVTANGVGVATITATANNGMYHECIIKVVSASGPSIVLTTENAIPNAISKVKASIVRNPGISGYKFTINYDDALLTPISVTANEEFGGTLTTNLDDENRTEFNVVWYSNGDTDIDINGELFTIDFKVAETAELGDYSDITIEYGAKDICNTAGENIALYTESAKVTVEEPLAGDIYEDGDVNIYDLTLLARHMIGLADFTDRQMEAANVTDDDLVDIKDVVKLAQYVVGWTGVELMSLMSLDDDIPETPTVTVGAASVNDINEADIPVYIKNNTGVAAYRFVLDYNADDIEIVSITPSDFINPENFGTNLGQENDEGLIVFCYQEGNVVADGELFTIKVRYKNPTDTSVSPISIKSAENNFCNQAIENVAVNYETGYALGDDYIVANKVVGDTNFSCELYFDDSYAEQSAKAIIAFYDADGRMVQLQPSDITVKPGKVDVSIDYDKKTYATYKLMIWEGMGNLKPITEVK